MSWSRFFGRKEQVSSQGIDPERKGRPLLETCNEIEQILRDVETEEKSTPDPESPTDKQLRNNVQDDAIRHASAVLYPELAEGERSEWCAQMKETIGELADNRENPNEEEGEQHVVSTNLQHPSDNPIQRFSADNYPGLAIEDVVIGSGTAFATTFIGIKNGPMGEAWIFAKKSCEAMQLNWPNQHRSLTQGQFATSGWISILEIHAPGDDRRREHIMLRADRVGTWLLGINANRVESEETALKLRYFQEHAADAIDAWLNGRVVPPPPPPSDEPSLRDLIAQMAASTLSMNQFMRDSEARFAQTLDRIGTQLERSQIAVRAANELTRVERQRALEHSRRADAAEHRMEEFRAVTRDYYHPDTVRGYDPTALVDYVGGIVELYARHSGHPTQEVWRHLYGLIRRDPNLRWVNADGDLVRFAMGTYRRRIPRIRGRAPSKIQTCLWATQQPGRAEGLDNSSFAWRIYETAWRTFIHGPLNGHLPVIEALQHTDEDEEADMDDLLDELN